MIFINLFRTFTIFTQRNSNSPRKSKGLFTPRESGSKSEKDHTTSKTDQRINDKHLWRFSPSLPLSFGVNGPQAVDVGSGCACYFTFSFEDVGSTCSFTSSFECTDSACCFDSSPLSSFLDNAREILPKNWRKIKVVFSRVCSGLRCVYIN